MGWINKQYQANVANKTNSKTSSAKFNYVPTLKAVCLRRWNVTFQNGICVFIPKLARKTKISMDIINMTLISRFAVSDSVK